MTGCTEFQIEIAEGLKSILRMDPFALVKLRRSAGSRWLKVSNRISRDISLSHQVQLSTHTLRFACLAFLVEDGEVWCETEADNVTGVEAVMVVVQPLYVVEERKMSFAPAISDTRQAGSNLLGSARRRYTATPQKMLRGGIFLALPVVEHDCRSFLGLSTQLTYLSSAYFVLFGGTMGKERIPNTLYQ